MSINKGFIIFNLFVIGMLFSAIATPLLAQDSSELANPPIRVLGPAQPSVVGLTPSQVRHAYGFDQISNQGAGQTIAIVDAFDNPVIERDLGVFSQTFNLPPCTTANSCFQKIYAGGHPPGVNMKVTWALEISLDVEWAHAIAPAARLILVEAKSDVLFDLLDAVDVAVKNGASVVSMSWQGAEFSDESELDTHFVASNVTFVAASGDFGNMGSYPPASPYVTGVGGTSLSLYANGNYAGETAWSGSGGGLSPYEPEPNYQANFNIPNNPGHHRGIPDVAYNSDLNSAFAVYTTLGFQGTRGWIEVAGTSAAAPQWAGLIAIVNSLRVAANKSALTGANASLYEVAQSNYAANYNDIVIGTNGTCGVICMASPGYDYVTGLGSPQANNLIIALAALP